MDINPELIQCKVVNIIPQNNNRLKKKEKGKERTKERREKNKNSVSSSECQSLQVLNSCAAFSSCYSIVYVCDS